MFRSQLMGSNAYSNNTLFIIDSPIMMDMEHIKSAYEKARGLHSIEFLN